MNTFPVISACILTERQRDKYVWRWPQAVAVCSARLVVTVKSVCLCAVLQVFQGIPEMLHPRARLHHQDIFPADAPHRPPGEGPASVGPRALLGPAHPQLRPRVLAESRASCCRPQTQTHPGGSLQGVRQEKEAQVHKQGSTPPCGAQLES